MKAKVDKFGRIVIPKKIREELGLTPGTALDIHEDRDRIIIRPLQEEPRIREEEGVWVYDGEIEGDADSVLKAQREDRIRRVSGGSR